MQTSLPLQDASVTPVDAARRLTLVLYALYALTIFTLFTGFIAIVINHVKYRDAAKTLYGSHFRWQMRTFWWGVAWFVLILVGLLATGKLWLGGGALGLAPVVAFLTLGLVWLWMAYRIIRGAVVCIDGRRMPV